MRGEFILNLDKSSYRSFSTIEEAEEWKSRISPLRSTRYWLWESACLQQKYRGLLRYLDCKR